MTVHFITPSFLWACISTSPRYLSRRAIAEEFALLKFLYCQVAFSKHYLLISYWFPSTEPKFPILANIGYINCFNLDSLTDELRLIFKQLPPGNWFLGKQWIIRRRDFLYWRNDNEFRLDLMSIDYFFLVLVSQKNGRC